MSAVELRLQGVSEARRESDAVIMDIIVNGTQGYTDVALMPDQIDDFAEAVAYRSLLHNYRKIGVELS